jgi:hypothetical protein
VDLSETEFTDDKAVCQDDFNDAQLLCEPLTGKKKKKCKKAAEKAALACHDALSCPPVGTKS